ncbi:uncharacterized protein LOC115231609 [Octopus sinensis]|uniref:Uncharacterized protein LOC115231609 n=1 Tax=Octopus sinensis TaxID=2607531 RepID=A0A6P7U917_9MOLL|nr:uncharacterized protein LOC115231609 [Octopus sinensis]
MNGVNNFFEAVGLEKNVEKSATNLANLGSEAKLLNGVEGYRYLGVLEDRRSDVLKSEVLKALFGELKKRIDNLSKTKLNSCKLFKAINEHALSLYNYYIGLVDIEPLEFEQIDKNVRSILVHHRIHLKPANKERLYLPRDQFGRGLVSITHKNERILLQFLRDLETKSRYCIRKEGILRVINSKRTHLATIAEYLKRKYNIQDIGSLDLNMLRELQKNSLIEQIMKKPLHAILFDCLNDSNVDVAESSHLLLHGNNSPRSEALLCFIQERNLFFDNVGAICSHCNSSKKTVDHLATRCGRMLNSDYLRRHNEVMKCVHLHLCREYGIKKSKKLKTHSVQSVVANNSVEIRVDTTINTDTKVENNKPDIFVLDKMRNTITLIEIGITSQKKLKQVEVEKLHKYDLLASELGLIHKAKVTIVPLVLTWDGVVSKYYKHHCDTIGLEELTRAYIQSECDGFDLRSPFKPFLDAKFGRKSALRRLDIAGFQVHPTGDPNKFYVANAKNRDYSSFSELTFSENCSFLNMTSDNLNMLSKLAEIFGYDE